MFLASVLVNTDRPMSYEPPTAPAELPTDVVDTLDDYSPELLRHVASYAEGLAEYREREARLAEEEEDEVEERSEDLPDDVPSKATITVKEINDNRYYYWRGEMATKSALSTKIPSIRTSSELTHNISSVARGEDQYPRFSCPLLRGGCTQDSGSSESTFIGGDTTITNSVKRRSQSFNTASNSLSDEYGNRSTSQPEDSEKSLSSRFS